MAMNGSVGLPVAVQVASMKYKDEECLAFMKLLEDSIGFKKLPTIEK
jgi:hypothetical protein